MSVDRGIIENMFDKSGTAGVIERMCAASRAENQAAGQRLAAISELDVVRLRQVGERETWCTDTHDAVCAEVAAALMISPNLANSYLYYARALRLRLPRVGSLLLAGDISYAMFQTIVYRTDLITDPDVLARVDAVLALRARRWPSMTRARLGALIDQVVARTDRDALRRRRERQADREFSIWDHSDGLTEVFGRLFSTDAHALDAQLTALANTVCPDDPRTHKERRADAMGALAARADRLECRCGRPDCPAGAHSVPHPVLIHVIAEHASLTGAASNPGSMIGADALIPAELLTDLARSAKLQPLIHPADAAPEPGYTPTPALADFVRCRDLTCRFPGCDRPALSADLDHTIPYADGGPTHASNLKALCRQHHLIKTFWGWHDQQLPDATIIWTSPAGHTYITTPASALLFPSLCAPTGELTPPEPPPTDKCTDRHLKMPQRRHTRTQNRARYLGAQRSHNRTERQARRQADKAAVAGPAPPQDDEPPPF